MKIYKKKDLSEEVIAEINNLFPARYHDCWIEDLPENIVKEIETLESKGDGLFIYGECGTGKTFILNAIAKNLNYIFFQNEVDAYEEKIKVDKYASKPSMYLRSKVFNSTEVSATFRKQAVIEYEKDQLLDVLINRTGKVLLLDDFCAEKYSEYIEECFYRILNSRWEAMESPLIITSNFSLKEISEKIGDRIASRIAGMCKVIKIEGKDRRLKSNK